ncbi:MAG TPA: hypothetical protein VFU31_05280 [Candidatus Binatia bacterium]|nr:hypothetical protein [Candidatus Binatia bacterium]
MTQGVELARLAMTDRSDIVLTSHHVSRRKDSGWRGEDNVIIPREAITSVSLEWHRNVGFIVAGAIVLLISLVPQVFTLPFELPLFVQPTVAAVGVAIMLLSLIKSKSLQIAGPTAAIEGEPDDYEEAEQFCDLLTRTKEPPPAGKNNDIEVASGDEAIDSKWHL